MFGIMNSGRRREEKSGPVRKLTPSENRRAIILMICAGLLLLLWPTFMIGEVKWQAAHYHPCFPTIVVDGKLCRVVQICYPTGPTHQCENVVTCDFTGPANGGDCTPK